MSLLKVTSRRREAKSALSSQFRFLSSKTWSVTSRTNLRIFGIPRNISRCGTWESLENKFNLQHKIVAVLKEIYYKRKYSTAESKPETQTFKSSISNKIAKYHAEIKTCSRPTHLILHHAVTGVPFSLVNHTHAQD